MKTIWKFHLIVETNQRFTIPRGARFLSVQGQHDEIVMWWLVDPRQPPESRRFSVYGTGHDMPDNPGAYLGTVQTDGGGFVWHAFEVS